MPSFTAVSATAGTYAHGRNATFTSHRWSKLQSSIPNFSQIFQQNHETLEGSFSAVSTPIFASKYSFCSVFRDLQDCHTFAPLEAQNLRKIFVKLFHIFAEISAKIAIFQQNSSKFALISMKIYQNFDE